MKKNNNTKNNFTKIEVKKVMNKLGVNPKIITLNEFHNAMNIENEHRNVTKGDPTITGEIVVAHLKEFPDYYIRLLEMENDAKKYWKNKNKPQIIL